jgi:alpha-tubulin suppressor-like RCC1 family protein
VTRSFRRALLLPFPVAFAVTFLVALPGGCSVRGEVLRPGDGASDSGGPVILHASDVRLSTGQSHTCAVSAGAMTCWGADGDGRLGVAPGGGGGQGPVTVSSGTGSPWVAPASGERHSCGLAADGGISCWGGNDLGQLGAGDFAASPAPRRVALPDKAVELRTSFDHTCALLVNATLWCWGSNDEGQLGQSDDFPGVDQPAPVQVGNDRDWVFVATGQGHTCGIRSPGALYCWGRDTDFELGQGDAAPAQIRAPVRVGVDLDWVEVSCGQGHTCARKHDGSLYCWGNIHSGALAVGDVGARPVPARVPLDPVWISVVTSTFDTCALRADGTILCAGRNTEGQIGAANLVDSVPNMQAADPNPGWLEVRTGRFFTCARKPDDSVWCIGINDDHELNADPSVSRSSTMLRAR